MSPESQNNSREKVISTKKLALVTSLLSLVAVWVALLPTRFIFQQFPPDMTVASFKRFWATLPLGWAFLFDNQTMGRLYVLAILLSAVIIWLGVRAQKNARLFAGQAGLVAGWCSGIAVALLFFFLPLFKTGEIVQGEYKGPKSEFTQIQFIHDSLYGAPTKLFMQREGEKEVAIAGAEGERWSNVEVADGTNKAFAVVFTDLPQPTNAPTEQVWYFWPRRVVEISLPMTNQPLTNYTIRTLWTCKPKEDAGRGDLMPSHMISTWDGAYLMVHSRIYGAPTNAAGSAMATCIYDVRESKFLNAPPVAP